jgi:hypothetical protein
LLGVGLSGAAVAAAAAADAAADGVLLNAAPEVDSLPP